MAELNGLPPEQHIGRTLRELLTSELADEVNGGRGRVLLLVLANGVHIFFTLASHAHNFCGRARMSSNNVSIRILGALSILHDSL
jgi:hypothetical protein